MTWPHNSVMLQDVVDAMAPAEGEVHVDCTLGAGGHAAAMLAAAPITLVGLDRDPDALEVARERLADFADRVHLVRARFSDLPRVLDDLGLSAVDGVYADFGVSSMQLDRPERGFSFRASGPLRMTMDPDATFDAAALVNEASQAELGGWIARYGEERFARRIARAIVQGRPWQDTEALANAIASAVPRPDRIHPATRTFQALRIVVNDELGEIEALLPAALDALRPEGRLAFLSFHSLEDRIVKRFIAEQSGRGVPRDPYGNPIHAPRLRAPARAARPSVDDPNPRARSARLRTAVRL